jgi:hypothetical protein
MPDEEKGQQHGLAATTSGSPDEEKGQQGEQQAAPPFWKGRVPDHLYDDNAEGMLRKLLPAYIGARDEIAKRGPVPKTADEYQFITNNDKLKPHIAKKDDPLLAAFRAAAHSAGISQRQAQTIVEMTLTPLLEKDLLGAPYDPAAELASIGKLLGHSEMNDQAKMAASQAVKEAEAWSDNLAKQLKLSENGTAELGSLLFTSAGFEVVRALQDAMKQPGFKLGGGGQSGVMSKAELDAWGAKPEINPMHPSFDKAKRQAYDDAWAAYIQAKQQGRISE